MALIQARSQDFAKGGAQILFLVLVRYLIQARSQDFFLKRGGGEGREAPSKNSSSQTCKCYYLDDVFSSIILVIDQNKFIKKRDIILILE